MKKLTKAIGWTVLGTTLLFGAYFCYLVLQGWMDEELKGK